MTIDQLIERLEEYKDLMGGEAEVRLMTQQSWPFENHIRGVCTTEEMNGHEPDEDEEDEEDMPDESVVYIVEGNQLGYGRKKAWEVCG